MWLKWQGSLSWGILHGRNHRLASSWLEKSLLLAVTLKMVLRRVISAPGADRGLLPDLANSVFPPLSNGSDIPSAPFCLYIKFFWRKGRIKHVLSGLCWTMAVISQICWVQSQSLPHWQTASAPSAQIGSWPCWGILKPISYYRHSPAISTSLANISQIAK